MMYRVFSQDWSKNDKHQVWYARPAWSDEDYYGPTGCAFTPEAALAQLVKLMYERENYPKPAREVRGDVSDG